VLELSTCTNYAMSLPTESSKFTGQRFYSFFFFLFFTRQRFIILRKSFFVCVTGEAYTIIVDKFKTQLSVGFSLFEIF